MATAHQKPPEEIVEPTPDFAGLIAAAKQLDEEAIEQLYRHCLQVVYRFALAHVGSVHIAEDVTSDVFLAFIEEITRLHASDEESLLAWLLRVARNKITDLRRHASTQVGRNIASLDSAVAGQLVQSIGPAAEDVNDPAAIIERQQEWAALASALSTLTEEQRTVIVYRYILDFDVDRVARLMSKKAGAVRALQFRALEMLHKHLKRLEFGTSRCAFERGGRHE